MDKKKREITINILLEDENSQKFNVWLKNCFHDLNEHYTFAAINSGIVYRFQKLAINEEYTSACIDPFYENKTKMGKCIFLKWIEVGANLKVMITFPSDPRIINPLWDILNDLNNDFPKMRDTIPNILQDLKNKYHFEYPLLPLNEPQPIDAAKLEMSQGIDNPGFEIMGIWELPVDWDVLVSASDSCLDGYAPGFVDKEIIKQLPASIIYRIWQRELGELGTVEIRKLGEKKSQIDISGVPLGAESLPDWEQTAKGLQGKSREVMHKALENKSQQEKIRRARLKNHQANVIQAYFSRLNQENIWQNAPELARLVDAGQVIEPPKPEKAIEDTTGWDTTLIEMWNKGHSRDEIANRVGVSKDRVTNRVTELRNKFGENKVPYDRERKKRLIKS